MLPEQKVEMIWVSTNKARFIDLGYCFTKIGDVFLVDVQHLTKYSKCKVMVQCDYCGEKIPKIYGNYTNEKAKLTINKDCCENCKYIKAKEIFESNRINKSNIRKCNSCDNEYELTSDNFRKRGTSVNGSIKFSYICKDCDKKEYQQKQDVKPKKSYTDDMAIDIYLNAVNNNISLPSSYWNRLSEVQIIKVFKCAIINNFGDDSKETLCKIDSNIIIKLKFSRITEKYSGGIYNLLNVAYPNILMPWELKSTSNNYWDNSSNKKEALCWLVCQLIKDEIITSIEEIPKKVNFQCFKDYRLQGMMAHHFNSSIYDAFNFIFPDKWKPWEFHTPKGFYQIEENRKFVMEWFVKKSIEDGIIMNIEEVPEKIDVNTFVNYDLDGFIRGYFMGSVLKAFDFLYPNKWYPWEFTTPTNFFKDKSNVKSALDWLVKKLINDGVINELKDVSNVVNYKTFDHNKLISLLREYDNVESIFVENYPDTFKVGDFKYIYSSDGVRLDSNEEYTVHEYLLKNFNKVQFNGNSTKNPAKWINEKYNESYIPDWIINDNIIVEHFGYSCPSSAKPRFINYIEKSNRKIDYFLSLSDYSFVSLFSEDLRFDLKGVKDKLSPYIK